MEELLIYTMGKTFDMLCSEFFMYGTGLCLIVGVLSFVYRLMGKVR